LKNKLIMAKNILFALITLVALTACDNKKSYGVEDYPTVNYAGTAGSWQLTSLDGEPLDATATAYAYMRMERRVADDTEGAVEWRAFRTYSTLSSAQTIERTGLYILKTDERGRATIEGMYDFHGYWQKDFYYIALTDNGNTMTWTACDDPNNVIVYTRVTDAFLDGVIAKMP